MKRSKSKKNEGVFFTDKTDQSFRGLHQSFGDADWYCFILEWRTSSEVFLILNVKLWGQTDKSTSPHRKSTSARLLIANTAATAAPHRLHPNPNPNPQTPRLQKRRKTRTVCYSVVKACIIMAGFAKGCSVYPYYKNVLTWCLGERI